MPPTNELLSTIVTSTSRGFPNSVDFTVALIASIWTFYNGYEMFKKRDRRSARILWILAGLALLTSTIVATGIGLRLWPVVFLVVLLIEVAIAIGLDWKTIGRTS